MSGGGGYPPDNSVQLEQMQEAAAEKERQRQDALAATQKAELAQLRTDAISGAQGSAQSYFTNQGLDYNQYLPYITDEINQLASSVPRDDPSPGMYFKNAGALAYDNAQTSTRGKYGREFDQFAPQNFEYTRVNDQLDDPILQAILGEKRGDADKIVQNMLNRGVITQTGYNADEQNLDKQTDTARAQLNEIGSLALEGGRSNLRDVANRGRSAAQTSTLGESFDPYSYSSQIDSAFNDFVTNLGSSIRGKASAPLFDTSGLAAIAGAGSGAQNTKFNPNALAGILGDDGTDSSTDPNRQSNAGTSVF